MADTYKIIRNYKNADIRPRIIKTGLTLEEARAHCSDPETSSRTATTPSARAHTQARGPWFDGYDLE